MKPSYEKYIPFKQIPLPDRTWPNNTITKAPVWCSVDLRDGNQALIDPMNLEEKLEFFHALVDMGFKEIEIGFPSASETEYEICRELIEKNHIPDDVTIQVLVQAREHLIHKTFEAIKGAKNVIVHFYNSTSTLQRKVVFKTDMQGVIDIAVEGARLIKKLTDEYTGDANIRFEYSPESFSGTEPDNAVAICDRVMEELGATKENPYRDENIGFFHICLEVEDIHEAWKKVVETGAPQDDAPKQGADFNWQCWTHDPDGIKIELMQLDEKSPQKQFVAGMKNN